MSTQLERSSSHRYNPLCMLHCDTLADMVLFVLMHWQTASLDVGQEDVSAPP